jgi:hypothetical protein
MHVSIFWLYIAAGWAPSYVLVQRMARRNENQLARRGRLISLSPAKLRRWWRAVPMLSHLSPSACGNTSSLSRLEAASMKSLRRMGNVGSRRVASSPSESARGQSLPGFYIYRYGNRGKWLWKLWDMLKNSWQATDAAAVALDSRWPNFVEKTRVVFLRKEKKEKGNRCGK